MNDLKFQQSGGGLVKKPSSRNLVAFFFGSEKYSSIVANTPRQLEASPRIAGLASKLECLTRQLQTSLSCYPCRQNPSSATDFSHNRLFPRLPSSIRASFGDCPPIRFNAGEFAFFALLPGFRSARECNLIGMHPLKADILSHLCME